MPDRPQARLVAVSLGCPDAPALAAFYAELLGGTVLWSGEKSAAVEVGATVLVAQRVEDHVPPVWPGASVVHLDLTADDLDAAAARARELGATEPAQPDPRWRVLLDPAGHPFCLTPFTPHAR